MGKARARRTVEWHGEAGTAREAPEWLRGECPRCGGELIPNSYYVGGRGYLVVWECRASGGGETGCDYRRAL